MNAENGIEVTIYRCRYKRGGDCYNCDDDAPSKSKENIRGDRICKDETTPTDDKEAFQCSGTDLYAEVVVVKKSLPGVKFAD